MRISFMPAVLPILMLSVPTPRVAESAPRPLVLKIESPTNGAIQYRSGWPLEFSMSPRRSGYTLGMDADAAMYPPLGLRSYIVFRDLDGCLDALENNDCPPPPGDELVFGFTPDVDYPGVPDTGAGADIRAIQLFLGNAPLFSYADGNSAFLVNFGPARLPFPPPVEDGLGYGPNDDLPGFVLLSNVGAGVVLKSAVGSAGAIEPDAFTEVTPRQRRNLAGLMTDVDFELVSGRGGRRTSVVRTSMRVPANLFARYRFIDFCVGGTPQDQYLCDGGVPMELVEGSSDIVPSNRWDDEFSSDPNLDSTNVSKVVLHAFVVEGQAPVFVEDCNLDNRVNAADAVCMGYNLLSNVVVVRFTQMGNHRNVCSPVFGGAWNRPGSDAVWAVAPSWFEIDIDGNGTIPGFICPSGGGRISTPPM